MLMEECNEQTIIEFDEAKDKKTEFKSNSKSVLGNEALRQLDQRYGVSVVRILYQ